MALAGLVMVGCRPPAQAKKDTSTVKVSKGSIDVTVVENGAIEAERVVEVKSRVAGRVKQLLVAEGDMVRKGDLIAVIDPQEIELQVQQNRAQLAGAQSAVQRSSIEIAQREQTARAALANAKSRLAQVESELKAQPTLTKTAITAAQSALDSARQAEAQLREATHPNERTILAAEVEQARLTLEQNRRELERQQGLYEQDFVSLRDVENARLQVDTANSRLIAAQQRLNRLDDQHALERRTAAERTKQAQAELDRAKANSIQDSVKRQQYVQAQQDVRTAQANLMDVQSLQASRAQSQASVDQIRSVLSDSERQLGETEIRAPMDGIITAELIQEGELVASLSSFSSGTPIVRLEDRSALLVKLNINEIDVAKLAIGMDATIGVDAITNKSFKGRVSKIAPARTQAATGASDPVVRFEVEVELTESDPRIKSGMTASCTMAVSSKKNVLVIPIDYLVKEGADRYILTPAAKKGDKPNRVKVTVGLETGSQVEILSGANEGQEIVRPEFTGPNRRGMGGQSS